ncbi:hypothetical protein [Streptomyces sp. JB150]|uniref:hypothetical protein n=1 Tax=Streptomyces sp. JB150 TaxID=2714844 RepID=UPI00140E6EF7|nr:hypothetical protein [Streptomyces sp. JB150]QIJ61201.1 hypothetical protein G7Z13_03530 [Streptomyces sp. JB150]
MTRLKPSSVITRPVRFTGSALRRMPGMDKVSKAAEGTLDAVGIVSPRGRRIAVYTGAGVLGAAGVVEWPVAIAGAAVAWLTQPRPGQEREREQGPDDASRATSPGGGAASEGDAASMSMGPGRSDASSGDPATESGMSAAASRMPAAASGARTTASPGRTTVSGTRTRTVHGTGTTTIKAATAHRRTAARRHTGTSG